MNAGQWFYWAICLTETDQLIGTICLWNFSEDRSRAEIGYELLPAFQGKGIMQEAVEAILAFGFEKLSLHGIEAIPTSDNKASIRLLEKNHFVKASTFTEKNSQGEEVEMVIFVRYNTA